MSSSSPTDDHLKKEQQAVALGEVEEAEQVSAQHARDTEKALGADLAVARDRNRKAGVVTFLWGLPGFLWLAFFLIAPVVFIVLVSFWTRTDSGFVKEWTLANYSDVLGSGTYWSAMWSSFLTSVISVLACLVFGFPVAYFLAMKIQSLRLQIALFIFALAPFWTSFLIRAVAWTYPVAGRQGAVNQALDGIGIITEPISALGFSELSVRVALIQLYILFMVTPLFFMLAQVDRSSLEAARDLGGNGFRVFKEVILPQTMPGVVIGSIFIFVLTMGEYGSVRVIGGGNVQSVGTIVQNRISAIQYPQGAASAVLLIAALVVGVFVITRFANLREEL